MTHEEDSTFLHPMSETEKISIDLEVEEIYNDNWFEPAKRGKWMLFYPRNLMDKKWQEAVKLYKNKELTGIQSIKCSTAAVNERAGDRTNGAIRFACGPYDDSEAVQSYGRNVVEKMNYTSPFGFIAYKTDEQSAIGTRATGARKNYYYRIPVATSDGYMQQ